MLDLTRWKRKKKKYSAIREFEPRIKILALVFVLCAILVAIKLFDFQVLKFNFYYALASDQHEIYTKIFAERGTIYLRDSLGSDLNTDNNLYPLAINKDYNLVYAQPKYLDRPAEEIADELVKILESDPVKQEETKKVLIEKLSKSDDPYEPLFHKVEDSTAQMIMSLDITGIKTSKETFRFYPEKNIGANVLGFVGYDAEGSKKGLYGVEGYFNDLLAGSQGEIRTEKDIAGHFISIGEKDFIPAKDGSDIILTIDKTVEYEVCSQLDERVKLVEADSGAVIVMEPKSGAIIAMCSSPDFDPNDYSKVESPEAYNNSAIYKAYEPGSIFKAITMAAGSDLMVITPETTYLDPGVEKIDDFEIKNSDKLAHGLKTMTEVLELSLNTGTIFVARKIGSKNFRNYVEKFGFGQKVGIQLDSEVDGNIESLKKKSEVYMATASFGQGIMVTPLQMVQAFSAIANGGKMVKPYIVEEVRDADGTIQEMSRPEPKQVISSKASTLLTGMLVSVIVNGHSKKAGIPGYYMAGKTGTAQSADKGGYANSLSNHSFIGFAPATDPVFIMIVKLENPKKGSFAESTAAPLFSSLAKFLLDYYHAVPDAL